MKRNILIATTSILVAVIGLGVYLLLAYNAKAQTDSKEPKKVIEINTEKFKELIYDFEATENTWRFRGDKPAIVDFYATWCGPCRILKPRLEQIAREYEGQVNVYSIDVDRNMKPARAMKVEALPTIVMIPTKGNPTKSVGALSVEQLRELTEKIIKESAAESQE